MTPYDSVGDRFVDRQASENIRLRTVEKELRMKISLAEGYLTAEKGRNKLLDDRLIQAHAKKRHAETEAARWKSLYQDQESVILELQQEVERLTLRDQLR